MKYLILIFLFTSCSHSLTLNPKGCYSKGLIKNLEKKIYTIEKSVVSFGSSSEHYLKEILESNKIDCRKIKNVNYTFKSDALDSILSVLPFIERKTLVINYSKD
ncbi:hypothetical protein [Halobacteriovorax sp.]|uniref:hypothetical protein n=1 Tax=Halobacteriovorax sp. TaxID=2020862 RepID=UPI00356B442E